MDQLGDIRKVRHKKYVKEVLLPNVKDMINKNKDPNATNTKILAQGFVSKFIPECVNIDPIEEEHIPPLFRMRLKMNSSNLVKPEIEKITGDEAQIDFTDSESDIIFPKKFIQPTNIHNGHNDHDDHNDHNDHDIHDIIKQSINEYEMNEEMELNKAIESSLQGISIIDTTMDTSIENAVDNDDIDNLLFETALMDSLAEHVVKFDDKKNNENTDDENEFFLCFDLRIFGPDPYQPIYFMELPYFFSLSQVDKIKQKWNKVNPDTSTGQQTEQDIKYMFDMATDLLNL